MKAKINRYRTLSEGSLYWDTKGSVCKFSDVEFVVTELESKLKEVQKELSKLKKQHRGGRASEVRNTSNT